jgi:transcriptional regulator with XRE-family HTH domain/DNA-binding CsgD family transcriptional regulator
MTAALTRPTVGTLPAHGTTARRHRGCGCLPCRRAQRRYDKRRRIYRTRGIAGRVPMSPVTEHVAVLRATGATLQAIADAADCSQGTILNIERSQHPTLFASIARRVLAVHPGMLAPAMVGAVGVARQVQALYVAGYPLAVLSAEFGFTRTYVSELANGRRERVTYATYRRIADAYARLSGAPGPSEYTRAWAARRGWLPPAAWEGLDIDDPAADPTVESAVSRYAVVAEEAAFFASQGLTQEGIAAHLGLSVNTLQIYLVRARRAAAGDRDPGADDALADLAA